ncbi:MAG: hypothetical protein K940chlam3_00214 [Chlamydiae bacterium]|nr:hypothetical protein [Chlamydiota bacterium]
MSNQNAPPIPKEIADLVDSDEWKGPPGKSIIGHRSAMIEYPENTRKLLEKKIFTFQDLIDFEWQEVQAILIHAEAIETLTTLGFDKKDFHLFDAPQLIEVVHHIEAFDEIVKEGITTTELSKFSGYQLKLVLENPKTMAAILKNFEGVDDLLQMRWNWIEEMLMRPEDALSLLEHGVKWHQIDHLPAWDFGWFLVHRQEILILLEYGIDFEIIARIDDKHLRLAPAFSPMIEAGLLHEDLEKLGFYQLFMILSHRDTFIDVMEKGFKEEFLKLDSFVMEKLLQNPDQMYLMRESDPNFLKELQGIRPVKVDMLIQWSDNFKTLASHGVTTAVIKPLSDDQFELVLENPSEFIPVVELATKFHLSPESALDIDLDVTAQFKANPEKVQTLLGIGLDIDDLTRYPLVLPQVIQYADSIVALAKKGVPTEDIFHLSTDQINYAFARFPLLDILPELGLKIKDLDFFQIEEFKVVLSSLKALSILKNGGVDLRGLSEITLPHLGIILKYPEYVLSLIRRGVPIYKFGRMNEHKLDVLLRDPLTPEAQVLIQNLMDM